MTDETTTAPETKTPPPPPAGTKSVKVNRNVAMPGSSVVVRDKTYVVGNDFTVDVPEDASDDELKGIAVK